MNRYLAKIAEIRLESEDAEDKQQRLKKSRLKTLQMERETNNADDAVNKDPAAFGKDFPPRVGWWP